MPTTSSTLDKQLTPLTPSEEEFFVRVHARVEAYFKDFEEVEGFSVLKTNLDRLFRKIALELRCVCYEYHDTFQSIEELHTNNKSLHEDLDRQQELMDQVILETQAFQTRFHAIHVQHTQEMKKLHTFYQTQESLLKKQWTLESESLHQQQLDTLAKDHQLQLELVQLEKTQRIETIQRQLEAKKQSELEYMEVQLRLQITSQVSRDLGKKMARQEKICEKHTKEMKQLQARLATLQDSIKAARKETIAR